MRLHWTVGAALLLPLNARGAGTPHNLAFHDAAARAEGEEGASGDSFLTRLWKKNHPRQQTAENAPLLGADSRPLLTDSADEGVLAPPAADVPPSSVVNIASLSSARREFVLSNALLLLLLTIGASLFTCQVLRWKDLPQVTDPLVGIGWGALLGAGLYFGADQTTDLVHEALSFNADLFFIALLPPIVFNSGYALSGKGGKHFYKNAGSITWFATLGTFIAFALTASGWQLLGLLRLAPVSWRECAAVGALFASTDLVPILPILEQLEPSPLLAALVRGESLLNDGVSIALYRAAVDGSSAWTGLVDFSKVFFGSIAVGLVMGLLTALLSKHLRLALKEEGSQAVETALLVLVVWVSYLVADLVSISGIIAILFMGVCVSRYTHANLSCGGQRSTAELFAVCSLVAETAISVLLGVAVFSSPRTLIRDIPLAAVVGVVLVAARVISVVGTSWLVNRFRSGDPITGSVQIAMIVCGVKGGVSFALAARAAEDFKGVNGRRMLNCTLILAVVSIALSSFVLPSLLLSMKQGSESHGRDARIAAKVEGRVNVGRLRRWLIRMDEAYLQRIFTNGRAVDSLQYEMGVISSTAGKEVELWEEEIYGNLAKSENRSPANSTPTSFPPTPDKNWMEKHADIF